MNRIKYAALLVTGVLALALAGCGGGDEDQPVVYHTVTYDGNGSTQGTVPVDTNEYAEGQAVIVLGNTGKLLKINVSGVSYGCRGWNTGSGGNGTNYGAGDTVFMGQSDLTLYARWLPYAVRDTGPSGGLVFYDKGSYTSAWRYMEAAPIDQNPAKWGGYGTAISGADDSTIGSGPLNTSQIIAHLGTDSMYAARVCDTLTAGGYTDWFLPSKLELERMYDTLRVYGRGGFTTTIYYWSSTEYNDTAARAHYFYNGLKHFRAKTYTYYVRAARVF
jgi:hypothetical protein